MTLLTTTRGQLNVAHGLITIGVLVLYLLTFSSAFAQERVESFTSDITIHEDATFTVTETISYDFGADDRRGVYRTIPIAFETASGTRMTAIEVMSIERDGVAEPYQVTERNGDIEIRIGDPDVYISGTHEYILHYMVSGAINYFDEYDELYWNVTGNEWSVPIDNVSVTVALPTQISEAELQSECYVGAVGETGECTTTTNLGMVSAQTNNLTDGEGLTIAVGFPKGVVEVVEPVYQQGVFGENDHILPMFLIVLVSVLTIVGAAAWRTRDPKGRGTIIARYEPPSGISPTTAGTLIDKRTDNRDITAGIISLAEQGYLTIERIEKTWILGSDDYQLMRTKKGQDESEIQKLNESEQLILDLLFHEIKGIHLSEFFALLRDKESQKNTQKETTRLLSKLKKSTSAPAYLQKIRTTIEKDLENMEYYISSKVRTKKTVNLTFIFLTTVFSVAIFSFLSRTINFMLATGIFVVLLTVVTIPSFKHLRSRLTQEGVYAKEHLLGFKEFLSVTDKERFAFHNAPDKSPKQFMEYLPYAIAFGVEKEWAKQFEDMYIDEPGWYAGHAGDSFTAPAFIASLDGFTSFANASVGGAAASGASGSGGGGASGGGFGGGGGGSW